MALYAQVMANDDRNMQGDDEQTLRNSDVTNEPVNQSPEARTDLPEIEKSPKKKKQKFSGAYWYVTTDETELKKQSFTRTLLTVIALMLQLVVLLLPQGGLEYVTKNIASYAYVYMWFVFVMLGVSVYVLIMNLTRYKIEKRIPVERAPKKGFKRRSFFGAELLVIMYFAIFAIELSFVCISYDAVGLVAMFVSLLAVGAAVWARMITVLTLKDAERIDPPAPDASSGDEPNSPEQ